MISIKCSSVVTANCISLIALDLKRGEFYHLAVLKLRGVSFFLFFCNNFRELTNFTTGMLPDG